MLFDPEHDEPLAKLEEQLRSVDAVTSGLMSDVIAIACVRFGALGSATKVKLKWLIETGAWSVFVNLLDHAGETARELHLVSAMMPRVYAKVA